jgi:uncharacterized protein (TIGR03083 family)
MPIGVELSGAAGFVDRLCGAHTDRYGLWFVWWVLSRAAETAEYLAAYLSIRGRVIELVRVHDWAAYVPACPGWRARDVVAHLTGLCEDWVDGRLEAYASDAWTAAQIARHAGTSNDALVSRWVEISNVFMSLDRAAVLDVAAPLAFRDALVHEADLREAFRVSTLPPGRAVQLALRGSMTRWRDEVLQKASVPSLVVRLPHLGEWRFDGPGEEQMIVAPGEYELFRALAGRRTRSQLRAWNWSSDPEVFLAAGLPYLFEFPAESVDAP